jgi:hypothetical protein
LVGKKPSKAGKSSDLEEDEDEDEEEEEDEHEVEEDKRRPMTKLEQLDMKISGKTTKSKNSSTESRPTSEILAYDKVASFVPCFPYVAHGVNFLLSLITVSGY